jgi:hypothetical protein
MSASWQKCEIHVMHKDEMKCNRYTVEVFISQGIIATISLQDWDNVND